MQYPWKLVSSELFGEKEQHMRSVRCSETDDGWIVVQVVVVKMADEQTEIDKTRFHQIRLKRDEFLAIAEAMKEVYVCDLTKEDPKATSARESSRRKNSAA